MDRELNIYCADIGSVKEGNFAWASIHANGSDRQCGDIGKLVEELADDLCGGRKVALGFECPLWIPVPPEPNQLGSARPEEGGKPWSAGAGAASLTTGLAQTAWILDGVRRKLASRQKFVPHTFFDWQQFVNADAGMFLWEAFVTGRAKGKSHSEDALLACKEFRKRLEDPAAKLTPTLLGGQVRSLIGASILWAGWSEDLAMLRVPCIVVEPPQAN